MFTGIVETLGTVLDIQVDDVTLPIPAPSTEDSTTLALLADAQPLSGWTMVIGKCGTILTDCKVGDSISVNGTCLTVTEFTASSFKVGLAPETLACTNLGQLAVGDPVNLERAMAAAARWHGHFVQGHVDGTVRMVRRECVRDSVVCTFTLPARWRWGVVAKGYVALDGTSLTVSKLTEDTFCVTLVAHTQPRTVLAFKQPTEHGVGYRTTANLEIDLVAKYLQRSLDLQRPALACAPRDECDATEICAVHECLRATLHAQMPRTP